MAVYPCVYRELDLILNMQRHEDGLSLCIQGTLVIKELYILRSRFIPVYTGNSITKNGNQLTVSVYPCVYRELLSSIAVREDKAGLSLCIQGTQLHPHHLLMV